MAEVLFNGQVYTIFENAPTVMENNRALVIREMRKKEKHTRERDWKQMARGNYRKK